MDQPGCLLGVTTDQYSLPRIRWGNTELPDPEQPEQQDHCYDQYQSQ
jgi:hypothetical protein